VKFSIRRRSAGLLAAAALALCPAARAQGDVSWAQALEAAWQRSADSTAAAAQRQQALAQQAVGNAWWAAPPALELGHRSDRLQSDTGARETEIGLAVPLWLPGQRAAQRSAASAQADAARRGEAAARLALAGLLRDAVADVQLRRAEADAATAEAQALDALRIDVERRVAAGDLARADALAAQAEALAAQSRTAQAAEALQRAELHWRTLTGLSALPALPTGAAAPATTLDDHPLLAEAAARAEWARRKLEVAQQSRRSPPELVTRWRQDVGGRGDASANSLGIALRIPLGTDDRAQPLLAAANAELDVAQAQAHQLRQQLAAVAEAQRLALQSIERQAADEQRRAALLRQRATLIETSFKAGETPLPDMLRALAAATQAEAAARRLQVQRGQALARLQQALGLLP